MPPNFWTTQSSSNDVEGESEGLDSGEEIVEAEGEYIDDADDEVVDEYMLTVKSFWKKRCGSEEMIMQSESYSSYRT